MSRHQVTKVGMIVCLVVVLLAPACTRSETVAARPGGEPRAASPSQAVNPCSKTSFVDATGTLIDWDSTEARFDDDGVFALPPKPDWIPVERYCSAILMAIAPAPTGPDGAKSVDPGVNLFVLASEATTWDEVGYSNAVLLAMYPGSVVPVWDAAGERLKGHLAPGVGFVSADEAMSAEAVAALPRVAAAAAELGTSCREQRCDAMVRAAIDSGHGSVLGSPTPDVR